MSDSRLILIGGGGHCKSCIDVIEQEGKSEIFGVLDAAEKLGEKVLGYEIIGTDDDIEKYVEQDCYFLITVGQIKTPSVRKKIFEKLISLNANLATVVSPRAYVSKHASLKSGTIVMHNSFVNAGAEVGGNCILNSGCNIDHDALIGDHCHISTGAFINGDCQLGNGVFVGSNATISSQVSVGDNVVIGAGTLVMKNVNSNSKIVGVPSKEL